MKIQSLIAVLVNAGCVNRSASRRSTSNSVKPPPPVRRSSSVTPSHQMDAVNAVRLNFNFSYFLYDLSFAFILPQQMQSNIMTSSSESLPPPPAYLLDSTGRTSPGKVCETVKALTELNHMPASPSVLRRAVAQMNSSPPQVNLIWQRNHFSLVA